MVNCDGVGIAAGASIGCPVAAATCIDGEMSCLGCIVIGTFLNLGACEKEAAANGDVRAMLTGAACITYWGPIAVKIGCGSPGIICECGTAITGLCACIR